MPNKQFLEDYPLFRKFKTNFPSTLDKFPRPPINMRCQTCDSIQTFNMINNYWEFYNVANALANDTKIRMPGFN